MLKNPGPLQPPSVFIFQLVLAMASMTHKRGVAGVSKSYRQTCSDFVISPSLPPELLLFKEPLPR